MLRGLFENLFYRRRLWIEVSFTSHRAVWSWKRIMCRLQWYPWFVPIAVGSYEFLALTILFSYLFFSIFLFLLSDKRPTYVLSYFWRLFSSFLPWPENLSRHYLLPHTFLLLLTIVKVVSLTLLPVTRNRFPSDS